MDGRIVMGYHGVLDDPGEDLVDSMSGGIVVGVSRSDGTMLDPTSGLHDLSGPGFIASTEIFERWCYQVADSCGQGRADLGWSGATNDTFDLDGANLVFTPVPGGFEVEGPFLFGDGFEGGGALAWSL